MPEISINPGGQAGFLQDFARRGRDALKRIGEPSVLHRGADSRGGGEAVFVEVDGMPRMTRGVIVRHLLLPGHLDDSRAVVRLLHERYGNAVQLSLMNQYTPIIAPDSPEGRRFPELLRRVPDDDYERLLDYADSLGIIEYYWQDGPAAEESFIPAFDYTGV